MSAECAPGGPRRAVDIGANGGKSFLGMGRMSLFMRGAIGKAMAARSPQYAPAPLMADDRRGARRRIPGGGLPPARGSGIIVRHYASNRHARRALFDALKRCRPAASCTAVCRRSKSNQSDGGRTVCMAADPGRRRQSAHMPVHDIRNCDWRRHLARTPFPCHLSLPCRIRGAPAIGTMRFGKR